MFRLLLLLFWAQAAFSQSTISPYYNHNDPFCYQLQRMLSAGLYDNFELLTITNERKTVLNASPDLSVTLPGFEKGYVDKDNYYVAIQPLLIDSATAADSLYHVWLHTISCLPEWQSGQMLAGPLTTFLRGTGTGYWVENKLFNLRMALIKKENARFVVALVAKRKK